MTAINSVGWSERDLGGAATILDNLRIPLSASQRAGRAGPFPYCGANGVLDYIDEFMIDDDVVLLAEDGGNFDQWRSRPIAYRMKGKIWVNNHAHVLKATRPGDTGFLFYALEHKDITPFISSGTRSKLTRGELVRIKVALPDDVTEQRRVAGALRDADDLIEVRERQIAKNCAIKQGIMQQLLTGKTRLPGFSAVWTPRLLRDIVDTPITDGPHLTPQFLSIGVPFLSVNNLVDGRIDFTGLRYISESDNAMFSRKCAPRKGDILFGKAASVGKVALVEKDLRFNVWSPLAVIRLASAHVPRFVYYALQSGSLLRQVALLTNSSSQGNIGMTDIGRLLINLPPRDEQNAIAATLKNIDDEIDVLREGLTKALEVKQGMMQELLTGRTRLPGETVS